jgi:hypothetical protein
MEGSTMSNTYFPATGHEVVLCEVQDRHGCWQRVAVCDDCIADNFALANPDGLYRAVIDTFEQGRICRHFQVKNHVLLPLQY